MTDEYEKDKEKRRQILVDAAYREKEKWVTFEPIGAGTGASNYWKMLFELLTLLIEK